MLRCVINIDILTYFSSCLIIFIFPSIISALNIGDYSYGNNIHPNVFNDQIQSTGNSNSIDCFLQERLSTHFDSTDKPSINILPLLPTYAHVKPHIPHIKLPGPPPDPPPGPPPPSVLDSPTTLSRAHKTHLTFDSTSFLSPPFPLPTLVHLPPRENHCKPDKRNSKKEKPKEKPNHQTNDRNVDDLDNSANYPDCDKYVAGHKPFLSDFLLQNVLKTYNDLCNATILTSGFISLSSNYSNNTTLFNNTDYNQLFPSLNRFMLASPSLLIQCSNDTYNDRPYHAINNNFTRFLIEVAQNYTDNYLIDDSSSMVHKDNFKNSVLVIIFSQTALCIAAWMMFLILLLLPSSNYNNRNFFVHIYVIFYAITQSVFLAKAYNGIFKWEYERCIQDASKYEEYIVDLTSFKVCELFWNILCNLNWTYIVIFMYNVDYLKNEITRHKALSEFSYEIGSFLEKGWLEILLELKNTVLNKFKGWIYKPKNRPLLYIIIICIVLTSINNTFFGILLWKKTRVDLRAVFKSSELLIYTLLLWRIGSFILRNFGMTITSTRTIDSLNFDSNSSLNNPVNYNTTNSKNDGTFLKKHLLLENLDNHLKYFQRWVSNIWKNYFNTVPLLIYNIIIYILCYFMIIYLTSISAYRYRWKYNLVHFIKLLITVNFWGLIGVLNRREIYLSRKTIIGRRINNHDNFFVEPCSSSSFSSSESLSEHLSNSFNFCENSGGTATIPNTSTADSGKNSTIQQDINNNKNRKPKENLPKIMYKYTISKPLKSLKPNFNRVKERRIQFIIEQTEKEK